MEGKKTFRIIRAVLLVGFVIAFLTIILCILSTEYKSTKTYDRNTILSAFIKTNLSGHIKICSNHFEVLLMNQMRAADDILDLPDWTVANAPYQILTLNEALTNNRSISIRLQSSKIQKTITHPSNRRLHAPSNMDLFYMEKPQEFLNNKEYEKSNYKLHYDENDDKK